GSYQPALTAALQAEQVGRDHLRNTIRYLPERQALAYAASRPKGLDLAISIAAVGSLPAANASYDAVIRSRGVILDEFAARARTSAIADPDVAALTATVAAARQRFANLVVRSL